MTSLGHHAQVVPAQVDFLALYNPSLSTSDHDLLEQIIYYYDRTSQRHGGGQKEPDQEDESSQEQEQNKRLRKIGLAQGMVEFAR